MTITTIITTYQRPALLKRAINSVLKQTYSDFQVCIYDNASDDQTEEIAQGFVKKDPRVKYYRHSKNIGMMLNYKYAFDKIGTSFFSLLSDDDFLLPCFYETALKGLHQFPTAAFSACGVLQMDEKGNFGGDPLSLWKSEGYYLPHEGLIEMIKTRWRFPIPTGILFRREVVKDIHPNFSEDIDFFWDPDYLIRIMARFPAVITKKCCSVYLAHSQAFACSFYSNLSNDAAVGEKYLKASQIVERGIEECSTLDAPHKRKAKQLFNEYVKQDAIFFMKTYIAHRKFDEAYFFSKKYYSYCGLSLRIVFYQLMTIVLIFSPFAAKCIPFYTNSIRCLARKILRKLPLNRVNPHCSEFLKECHDYGQKLLDGRDFSD